MPATGSLRWMTLPLIALALSMAACEPEPEEDEEAAVEITVPPEEAPVAPAPEEHRPARLVLKPVAYGELPGWHDDALAEALPALRLSCARLLTRGDDKAVGPAALAGTVSDWLGPCDALRALDEGDHEGVQVVFQAWFAPFKVMDQDREFGTYTGYYEPELQGSLTPNGPEAVPLYRRPPDLVTVDLGRFRADLAGERVFGRVEGGSLVPYHSRAEIDAGVLADRDLELLWIDDPIEAFFLHIQGSGQVALPGGSVQRVGYAGSNGLPFTGIGRTLLDAGLISPAEASMQGVRAWLRANPETAGEMMRRNRRYIFFRFIDADGPIGTQGVPLVAGRSLAVDPAFLPLGVPLFLDTTWPGSERPLRRLMVAQDTGSAIKGPLRGDFFWGAGEAALAEAGRMHQKGVAYLFLPHSVAERRKATN